MDWFTLTEDDMNDYGYIWDGMIPLTEEEAIGVNEICTVYKLYEDDSESEVENEEDIRAHASCGGIFGVEKSTWKKLLQTLGGKV